MNLIERVARAICVASGHNPDGPTCDVLSYTDPDCIYPWAGYRNQARAAIEEMREPTGRMLTCPIELATVTANPISAHVNRRGVWQAMIDAAITESGT